MMMMMRGSWSPSRKTPGRSACARVLGEGCGARRPCRSRLQTTRRDLKGPGSHSHILQATGSCGPTRELSEANAECSPHPPIWGGHCQSKQLEFRQR
ncbi:unnamed protein product [Ectocarpus sp. 8 AP-2014]